jgi:hypothetical protein
VGFQGVEIFSQDPQGGPKQLRVPLHFWREPPVATANLQQEIHIAQKVLGRFTPISRRGSDGGEEEVEREWLAALSQLTSKLEGDSPPHAVPEYHQRNLFHSSQGISDGFYKIQKSAGDGFRIAALTPRSHHRPELYPPGESRVPDMEEPGTGTGGRDGQEAKLSPRTRVSADQPPVSGDDQGSSPPREAERRGGPVTFTQHAPSGTLHGRSSRINSVITDNDMPPGYNSCYRPPSRTLIPAGKG